MPLPIAAAVAGKALLGGIGRKIFGAAAKRAAGGFVKKLGLNMLTKGNKASTVGQLRTLLQQSGPKKAFDAFAKKNPEGAEALKDLLKHEAQQAILGILLRG